MNNELEKYRGVLAGRVIDKRCPECGAQIGLGQALCNNCQSKNDGDFDDTLDVIADKILASAESDDERASMLRADPTLSPKHRKRARLLRRSTYGD